MPSSACMVPFQPYFCFCSTTFGPRAANRCACLAHYLYCLAVKSTVEPASLLLELLQLTLPAVMGSHLPDSSIHCAAGAQASRPVRPS